MKFNFNQAVHTPKGNGFFIGTMAGGTHCQVAMKENNVQRNRIFRMDEVTEATEQKRARQPKPEADPVFRVDNTL